MVAAVTNLRFLFCLTYCLISSCFFISRVSAAVLPEDRIDVLYHNYDGGGMKIDGPSILIRKSIGEDFSLNANYYIDTLSSASIGVAYEFSLGSMGFIDRGTANLQIDYMEFDYDNFRDATAGGYSPGTEPLYGFSAVVTRFFYRHGFSIISKSSFD